MPSLTAVWVPGTAARVEFPERLTFRPPAFAADGTTLTPAQRDISINGANITFSQKFVGAGGNNSNWFHFPIHTPVILNDVRVQLVQVFVLFHAQLAKISSVHIWDGPNRIHARSPGSDGNHLDQIDPLNTFTLNPPQTVYWGIDISVEVDFLGEELAKPQLRSLVVFSTAGADFLTP